jgi:hypothetical protein
MLPLVRVHGQTVAREAPQAADSPEVFLTFVLQHIEEADHMFAEVARVLRRGGAVAVAGWGQIRDARLRRRGWRRSMSSARRLLQRYQV